MKSKKGFTLLEILLVVGIIAILAGIVIVAINPSKQLATVRNTQRKSDIKQVANAIIQFYIDHSYYPASTTFSTTPLMTICPTGASTSPAAGFNCAANNLLNLSELVPTYITAIPNDPGTTTTAGYSVMLVNKQPAVSAPLAELGVRVVVGNVPVAPTSPTACSATGGTISTTTGYKIHTFTTVGTSTFTVTGSCNVEVLVVAGGGGGSAGGGGAGGVIATSSVVSAASYPIVVGSGGAGKVQNSVSGDNGLDTTAFGLIAVGGGGGGKTSASGFGGGSGGGGGSSASAVRMGGSAMNGQGNIGGTSGFTDGQYPSGGGGGATAAGQSAPNNYTGGSGGEGLTNSLTGVSVVYGSGGGGGTHTNDGIRGVGGTGAGNGFAGSANGSNATGYGSGGGGCGLGATGGSGKSGVVIVRYAN
jgi:prepilin-type N-terminal cleavage/methylation domain-containing protein